ncbi:MAG: 50S ribosomal protein L6 [Candidatus Eisenbacteria bacterium]|nr:50S ribosomal protein L6 [Candidatus Eisenbacteria bacterium]
MSRIGRQPVPIPAGVDVRVTDGVVEVKGPKGALNYAHHPEIRVEVKEGAIHVTRPTDEPKHRSLHGLVRTLIANLVEGVTKGYERSLEINGVGYRAQLEGNTVSLSLGFAAPIQYVPPEGVDVTVEGNRVIVRGIDKKMVGEVAAKIRSFRPPEPYNGKGVKYLEEVIKRKAGKATA